MPWLGARFIAAPAGVIAYIGPVILANWLHARCDGSAMTTPGRWRAITQPFVRRGLADGDSADCRRSVTRRRNSGTILAKSMSARGVERYGW